MKTFISLYLDNSVVPSDILIYDGLEFVGYNGYIPKTFIADLLIFSKMKLLKLNLPVIENDYTNSLQKIVNTVVINSWVYDMMFFLKRLSKEYDLRVIEAYANEGKELGFDIIDFSFNYVFDIHSIDEYTQKLLKISEQEIQEIEKLPDAIIEVLTIANGLGSFLKTSKKITSYNKPMTSYGDIIKINKHNLADPLFKYKFSIKAYDINSDVVVNNKSNKIIIGYFLGNYKRQDLVSLLLKLLGVILLNNYTEGVKIVVYSFYTDVYSKKELTSRDEIIQYFSEPKQLKLFAINNTKSLETMVVENPGDDVIFLPNILGNCQIKNNVSGTNRVNIISAKESAYNLQYSNVCKKTGGTFLTI